MSVNLDLPPIVDIDDSLDAIIDFFETQQWTDGLPFIPPTRQRVDEMFRYVDFKPDDVIATLAPRNGEATVEALAINAVMAGCRPEYFPVVVAATQAVAEKPFNLNGIQSTTHSCAVLVFVNGPIGREININNGYNLFGQGFRANATIGRAMRLILLNIAGGTPGEGDRSTIGTNLFVPEEGTKIRAHNRTWSLFATDTFSVNEKLSVTASARYNNTHIVLGDRTSQSNLTSPENPALLNGEHDFDRINPALGFTYNFNYSNGIYGSYSESSRAPTPIELLCADINAPCSLPNAFLADPPLEQVVTKSFEGGLRGTLKNGIAYTVSAYHSTNNDDIIFGSVGGTTSSRGFFRNVGDTQRVGTEFGLSGILKEKIDWYFNYSFIEATFEDNFNGVSAQHPNRIDLNGDGTANEIRVEAGDRIPGIPEHSIKIGGTYNLNDRFSIGVGGIYNSDQVLRGDESNQLATIDDYFIVNVNSTYKINKNFSFFAKINNLFDTDYETFGLLGEADEIFAAFDDARFLGAGAPIAIFVGLRATF